MSKEVAKLVLIVGLMFGLWFGIPISMGMPISKLSTTLKITPVTPLSPLYYLKMAREEMQGIWVIGPEDEAHFRLLRAEKRLAEAEYLGRVGIDSIKNRQLGLAKVYEHEGEELTQEVSQKVDVGYLKSMIQRNRTRIAQIEN